MLSSTSCDFLTDSEAMKLFSRVKRQIMAERTLPDEFKTFIFALRLSGYKYGEIAALFGIAEEQVRLVLRDPSFSSPRLQELYEKTQATLRDRMMALATTILSSISDDDLENASLLQKTTSLSMLIDKSRLLEGKSTQNIGMAYELTRGGKPVKPSELALLEAELHGV